MCAAKRSLILGHATVGSRSWRPKDVVIGVRCTAARLREQRAVGLIGRGVRGRDCSIRVLNEIGAGGELEIALCLVAVAGRESIHAHARNDMNLRDGMKVVLRVERHIVLLEIA